MYIHMYMYIYIYIYIYVYLYIYVCMYILSHVWKMKFQSTILGILQDFTPKVCPFPNEKAQILEIWPPAAESTRKKIAAVKS